MTSQGSQYGRFRRALDRRNLVEALSSAAEMKYVSLTDALQLCLLIAEKEPARYERAALAWHGRFTRNLRGVDFAEAQAVLGLLGMLRGERPAPAAAALAHLLGRRWRMQQAAELLLRWWLAPGRKLCSIRHALSGLDGKRPRSLRAQSR